MRFEACSVYLHAHTDDWQFFQSPNIYNDVQKGNRTLIIVVSASVPTPQSYATNTAREYGHAREEGNKASVALLAGSTNGSDEWVTVKGHRIATSTFRRVTLLSMRLPTCAWGQLLCGNDPELSQTMGYGWPTFNCESLGQLRDKGKSIHAIDGSATYASWSDLVSTIECIVDYYNADDGSPILLNAPDFDRSLNPNDHPDHYAVADAAKVLVGRLGWRSVLFADYDVANRPMNLSAREQEIKRRFFETYTTRVVELYGSDPDYAMNFPLYNRFLLSTYSRTI
jgi:hypothetical protein